MAKNKNMQPMKDAQAMVQDNAPEAVEFETWFAAREKQIPRHHHREILKADFNARGLEDMATMADWDAALKMYGVDLAI